MGLGNDFINSINNTLSYMNNNMVYNPIFIFLIVFIIFAIVFSLGMRENISMPNDLSLFSGLSNSSTQIGSSNSLSSILLTLVICIIVFFIFQYLLNTYFKAYLINMFSHHPEIDIVVDHHNPPPNSNGPGSSSSSGSSSIPEIKFRKQVFNIPGNSYTYDNANALCKAYGASLATYKQVEDAYENGGEWCNYGWSDKQMALFPTQIATFDHLQTIKGHEHDCGRPGINGGYIANPNVRFGVNCYGYKPKINEDEEQMMKNVSPYPQTMEDIEMEKKVDYWKNQVDQILVSPFNHQRWGEL